MNGRMHSLSQYEFSYKLIRLLIENSLTFWEIVPTWLFLLKDFSDCTCVHWTRSIFTAGIFRTFCSAATLEGATDPTPLSRWKIPLFIGTFYSLSLSVQSHRVGYWFSVNNRYSNSSSFRRTWASGRYPTETAAGWGPYNHSCAEKWGHWRLYLLG